MPLEVSVTLFWGRAEIRGLRPFIVGEIMIHDIMRVFIFLGVYIYCCVEWAFYKSLYDPKNPKNKDRAVIEYVPMCLSRLHFKR